MDDQREVRSVEKVFNAAGWRHSELRLCIDFLVLYRRHDANAGIAKSHDHESAIVSFVFNSDANGQIRVLCSSRKGSKGFNLAEMHSTTERRGL